MAQSLHQPTICKVVQPGLDKRNIQIDDFRIIKNEGKKIKMIEFRNVSKTYDTGTKAVKNANFVIDKGEFAFLVGT